MGVNGAATAASCSSSSTSLAINYTSGGDIGSGSSITIKVVGITNPLSPMTRTFGITTYYNSSSITSKVEYNTGAFNATYSAITNLSITMTPSTFTVYTYTSVNISFVSPVEIPALSTFLLTFPSDVTQITAASQSLTVNSSSALLNSTPTTTGSTVTFYNAQIIALGSSLTITLSLRSPTYVQTFAYVQLLVSQNSAVYIQSLATMTIQVTLPGVMPVSIEPADPITGGNSSYQITLTLTIPHPSIFTTIVDFGSDVKFNSVGATCTSATLCNSLSAIGNNTLTFSVNNPSPNSTSPVNLVFTLS